jgi:hypothetical protein
MAHWRLPGADTTTTPAAPRYFSQQRTLPRQYWVGLQRNGTYSPYAFMDTSYVEQAASNEPYAHW